MENFYKEDFKSMSAVFQITEETVKSSKVTDVETLDAESIGYWCVLIKNTYQIWADTKEEAEQVRELLSNN